MGLCAIVVATIVAACAEIGTAPDQPAAIEMLPFPFPAVVVGDTLRDEAGLVAPVRAIVRNTAGEEIADAPVQYLYADFNRDSAFAVDSATGIVVAKKALGNDGRIAARVGSSLQVLRSLLTTVRPDTAIAQAVPPLLITLQPDTGRERARINTTPELSVSVQNRQSSIQVPVNGWLVRFRLLRPANPTNDTMAAAFLVDEQQRPSVLDTTNSGLAGRRVRVRAAQFPAAPGTDTVVVEAVLSYKGVAVKGSPLRLVAPVARASSGS